MTNLSHAIVTPTYRGDFERCALLVESLGRIGGTHRHYLIVDRRDRAIFAPLASARTILIESEAILPRWLHRWPGDKSYWLSLRAPPVRGWIVQQILKIASPAAIPEDVLVFCDSDTAFFRDFTLADVMTGDRIDLLDVDYTGGWPLLWVDVACRLLDVSRDALPVRGHVGNMICWRRENVLAMQRRIEAVTGRSWQLALARELRFSEYMLYGIFVRGVPGHDAAGHVPSTRPLIRASWQQDLDDAGAMAAFFADFPPETVGVMVHSKDGIDPARVRAHLERLWAEDRSARNA